MYLIEWENKAINDGDNETRLRYYYCYFTSKFFAVVCIIQRRLSIRNLLTGLYTFYVHKQYIKLHDIVNCDCKSRIFDEVASAVTYDSFIRISELYFPD